MKRLILIDGNNWGFAGMANPKLSAGGKDTQAILSVLRKVRNVYENHPDALVMVLWDGRSWRKDVYPEYKANREKTEKQTEAKSAYLEQKTDIMAGLELLGVRQVTAGNQEADDLAYTLTKNAIAKGTPVTLLTADHDWMQLVQRGVNWVNVIHDQTCRYSTFKKDTGYDNPEQFVEAKCVLGDAGDNIKGVHGIGPKALEGIYKGYSSFLTFLQAMETDREAQILGWHVLNGKNMPKALRELDLKETHNKYQANQVLMNLATTSRPPIQNLKNRQAPLDKAAFEAFCNRNAFRSITRHLDDFIAPFERNINVIRQAS